MEQLAVHLALHGVAVLTVSVVAGLVLWRVLYHDRDGADWHLVHASGSVRGIFLIALAAIIDLPALPEWLVAIAAWLIILFAWTSLIAMIIRAFSGERGFHSGGSKVNSAVYVLYAMGTVALFSACAILLVGLLKAL
jgi:hypothetical protein